MSGRPTHPLEAWTRQTFGEDFAGLVLHGLLSDAETRTGRITVEGADQNGRKRRKTIAFAKPRPEAWGHKPLVLAALLKQLVGQRSIERKLVYTFKALLAELMWPDVPANWRVVRDALESYQACTYSSDGVHDDGTKRHAMRGHCALLTQLYFGGGGTPGRDLFSDLAQTVAFDVDFVEGLLRWKVFFAGTDFGELSAKPATPGAGGGQGPGGATRTAAPSPECPFRPPGPRPALLFEVTPLSLGPSDLWSDVGERAVGETTISIDTGAKANAVLRLVKRVVARYPPEHACPRSGSGPSPSTCAARLTGAFEKVCARSRRPCPSVSSKTSSCRAGA